MIYGAIVQESFVSPDEINQLCESLNTGLYLQEAVKNPWEMYVDFMGNSGVSAAMSIQHFQECAEDIANKIKKNGLEKQTIEYIQIRTQNLWQEIANDTTMVDTFKDDKRFLGLDSQKLGQALHLTLWVLTINTLFSMIVALLFGFQVSNILTACICAPICEETSKHIATKGKFEKEFMVVFNALEFSLYVKNFAKSVGLGTILLLRTVCVGFHVSLQLIHYLTNNKKVQEKLGLTSEADKAQLSILGKTTATILHAMWNIAASFA